MKVRYHFIEKLFFLVLILKAFHFMDDHIILGFCLLLLGLTFYFQGAKPYWPLIILLVILEMVQWNFLQWVLIVLTGFAITLIKFYEVPIPLQGGYNAGYKYLSIDQIQLGLFYPSAQKGKKANWFTKKDYFKTLYDIFYVDPETKRMPYFIFAFLVSFISKIQMPCFRKVAFAKQGDQAQRRIKVVLFSHGLGANMNAYSSYCGWLASKGFVVLSIQHDNDRVFLDPAPLTKQEPWKIRDFLYEERKIDLLIRVEQVKKVLEKVIEGKIFEQELGIKCKIDQLYLSGQSYGGGTMLQTFAQLIRQKKDHHIKSLLLLDPWMFPLQSYTYETIKNKDILIINSQTFYERVPFIYELQTKLNNLKENNKYSLKALFITKMNHLDQSDMAFIFGNVLQLFRQNAHHYLSQQILGANLHIIDLFLQGKSIQDIVKEGNEFCKQNELDQYGFEVRVENRLKASITEEVKKENQAIQQKLYKNVSVFKALFN